jgi:chromosome partitioning protein
MAKIVGVIQVKGGAGRSTLATNLAGELEKVGRTVLIDGDMPQGTSASWCAMREQAGKLTSLVADTAADHRELIAKVEWHAKSADFIVLDGPPRIAEMTRAIMVLADLCLVPVGASVAEIWATGDVLTIIEQAKKVRPIEARMVWTRHRSFTNLAKELTELSTAELGLPILRTTLGLRVAYPEALGAGLTVAELPDPQARGEMASLVAEVRSILRRH